MPAQVGLEGKTAKSRRGKAAKRGLSIFQKYPVMIESVQTGAPVKTSTNDLCSFSLMCEANPSRTRHNGATARADPFF